MQTPRGVHTSSSSLAPPPCRLALVTNSDTASRTSSIRSTSSCSGSCPGAEPSPQVVIAARVNARLAAAGRFEAAQFQTPHTRALRAARLETIAYVHRRSSLRRTARPVRPGPRPGRESAAHGCCLLLALLRACLHDARPLGPGCAEPSGSSRGRTARAPGEGQVRLAQRLAAGEPAAARKSSRLTAPPVSSSHSTRTPDRPPCQEAGVSSESSGARCHSTQAWPCRYPKIRTGRLPVQISTRDGQTEHVYMNRISIRCPSTPI